MKKSNLPKKSIFNINGETDQTSKQPQPDTEYLDEAAADGENITDSEDSDSSVHSELIKNNEQDNDSISSNEFSNQIIVLATEEIILPDPVLQDEGMPDSKGELEKTTDPQTLLGDGEHSSEDVSVSVTTEFPKGLPEKYLDDAGSVTDQPKLMLTHSKTFTTTDSCEEWGGMGENINKTDGKMKKSSLGTGNDATVHDGNIGRVTNKKKNAIGSLPTDNEKWCEATSRRMLFTQKLKSLKYRTGSTATNHMSSKHSTFGQLPPGTVRRSKTVADMKNRAFPSPRSNLAPATFTSFRTDCKRIRPSRSLTDNKLNTVCITGKALTSCKSKTHIPKARSCDSFSRLAKTLTPSRSIPPVFPVKCHSAPLLQVEEPIDANTDLCPKFDLLNLNCPDRIDNNISGTDKLNGDELPLTDNPNKQISLTDQARAGYSSSEPCDDETGSTGKTMQASTGACC